MILSELPPEGQQNAIDFRDFRDKAHNSQTSTRLFQLEIKTSSLRASLEQFSIDCRKTKTKLITYQLDYSANLKP